MIRALRKTPENKWDWTPNQAAPTSRTIAAHTWQWLICDRQHLAEPDALKHAPIPEPPTDPNEMCDELVKECDRWRELILAITPEQFEKEGSQFNLEPHNVRDFVCHMVQNVIYKHGQLSLLFFSLGLDGTEAYSAQFPQDFYHALHDGNLS